MSGDKTRTVEDDIDELFAMIGGSPSSGRGSGASSIGSLRLEIGDDTDSGGASADSPEVDKMNAASTLAAMSQKPVVRAEPAPQASAAPSEQDDGAAYGFSAVFQQAESSRKLTDSEKESVFDHYKDLDFRPQLDLYLVHEDSIGEAIEKAWLRAHGTDSVTAFNNKRRDLLQVIPTSSAKASNDFWQKWATFIHLPEPKEKAKPLTFITTGEQLKDQWKLASRVWNRGSKKRKRAPEPSAAGSGLHFDDHALIEHMLVTLHFE